MAASAWAGALTGLQLDGALAAGVAAVVTTAALGTAAGIRVRRGPDDRATTLAALALVFAALAGSGALREHAVTSSPVAALAADRAFVSARLAVTSDPRRHRTGYRESVLVRGRVLEVTGRGHRYRASVPVLVLGEEAWLRVPLGATVRASGLLAPASGGLGAFLRARGDPQLESPPAAWWTAAETVRRSLRDSVAHLPEHPRALVPALVVGDDAAMDPGLAEDFRATGLTHLLAVSGTNLTLLVGFLLVLARWLGVRGRGLYAVGAVGIVGFVLLARAEPSVVRAAAMGTVALLGLGADGRRRGSRGLGVAVLALLLLQPALAVTVGFALSVAATAGIIFLAPRWRDALQRWLPRWLAEAVSVPAAAQLACTPLVAALSGQVSLVAVAANLLVAPAVGPATVLGLAGGLLDLLWAPLGRPAGSAAGGCVAWIVLVAERGASLPTAAVGWGSDPVSITLLTAGCGGLAVLAPRVLGHRTLTLGLSVLVTVVVATRPPAPGWPPAGWVLTACDVGQGDGLVLNAGDGAAVVVDTGPDPSLMDACLHRLEVSRVPLVVLTHGHADHVGGLPGVGEDRQVGEVVTSSRAEGWATTAAVGAGTPRSVATYGQTRRIGEVTVQTLWPPARPPSLGDSESAQENNASVVLLAEVGGVRMLLTGDVEPEAQAALARTVPGLSADVLKVPHHGSPHQDLDLLLGLGARAAVVSVGADNDYGHPSPAVVDTLADAGIRVLRTDQHGDVALVHRDGALLVAFRRG